MLFIPRPVVARATVHGDAEDALALSKEVEARVDETVAVVFARGFRLGQLLGIGNRDALQFLPTLGCRDVNGIGDSVADGHKVIVVVAQSSGIHTHARGIAARTGTYAAAG